MKVNIDKFTWSRQNLTIEASDLGVPPGTLPAEIEVKGIRDTFTFLNP
jgi:hypothetical protein